MIKKTLTSCIYCGCGCGMYLISDGNKLIGTQPSENHPVTKGSLCVKGWNAHEFGNKKSRLTHPLIKENGKFRKASWDEAYKLIADKFQTAQKKHGNDSVAFFSSAKTSNEENYLMMKLSRAVFKTNNVDHCARLCHASTVAGLAATFGSGAMTNSIEEFERADCFFIIGSDTSSQHPLIGSRIINSVKNRGAKLLLMDPRKIHLSQMATVHAQHKNGTDVALLNGLMHIIIREGLEDKKFIEDRTENYNELKELVKDYNPQYVSKITGVPQEQLIEIAKIYATTRKAMIVYSMGITQHITGTDNVKSCANIAMLTGHVGIECAGVNPLRGQNNVQGACDMGALPVCFTSYQKVTDENVRKKFEKAWGVTNLPAENGLTVTEVVDGLGSGKVQALYIMGENPVVSDPNQNHVIECLEKANFLVVQDIFLTPTAEYADVVLPAASFAEKDGTITSTERRCERMRKAIDAPGEAKPDWQILGEFAKVCGYDKMMYDGPKKIMDEITTVSPHYAGMKYSRLEPFGLSWPCLDDNHPGTTYLHKDKFAKGKGTFMPRPYIEPNELPDEEYNFLLSTGRIYWHFHTRTMSGNTTTLEREAPVPYVEINPADARELGVRNGGKLKVTSRRGTLELIATVTDKVCVKSCFIPFHYIEGPANILTNNAIDPVAKIPELKVCAVKIEKV